MSQQTTWPTWLAALFVTSLFSFGMGFSLHWAITQSGGAPVDAAATPPAHDGNPASITPANEPAATLALSDAARHFFVAVPGAFLTPETKAMLSGVQPGGVVLRAENIQSSSQVLQLVRDIKTAAGSSDPRFSDLPLVMLHDPAEAARNLGWDQPAAAGYAAAFADAASASRSSMSLGRLSAAMGIGVLLGPSLSQNGPLPGGTTFSSEGPSGTMLSATGLAYTTGLMDGGVLPVVKTFPRETAQPGFGSPTGSVGQLAADMLPFEEMVAQGVPGVVVGHSPVPELDQGFRDRPASQSPLIVTALLRERWGFNGVIVADDIARRTATGNRSVEETAVSTLQAGCDVMLMLDPAPAKIRAAAAAVAAAVDGGMIDPRALEAASRRLGMWQTWLDRVLPQPAAAVAADEPVAMLARKPVAAIEEPPPAPPAPDPIVEEEAATAPEQVAMDITTQENGEDDWVLPVSDATPEAPSADAPAEEPANETAEAGEGDETEAAPADEVEEPVADETPIVEEPTTDAAPAAEEETAPAPDAVEDDAPGDATDDTETMMVASLPAEDAETPLEAAATAMDEETPADVADTTETEPVDDEAPAEEPAPGDAPPVTETDASVDEDTTEPAEETAEKDVETPSGEPITHTVVAGDTLSGIAVRYDVSSKDIMAWNDMDDAQINLGAKIVIHGGDTSPPSRPPASFATHEIQPGDTLSRIARMYDVTRDQLLELNGLENPNQILIGQKLRVPRQDHPGPR